MSLSVLRTSAQPAAAKVGDHGLSVDGGSLDGSESAGQPRSRRFRAPRPEPTGQRTGCAVQTRALAGDEGGGSPSPRSAGCRCWSRDD